MSSPFIESLNNELAALPVNSNRFYMKFRDELLPTEQLKRFAEQYFWFCNNFVRVLVGLIYNAPNDDIPLRLELIKTLYSEMGYGKIQAVHINLLKQFMAALGYTEDDLQKIRPIQEVKKYIESLDELYLRGDFREALGAEFGVETTAATEFSYLCPGIEKYPQFTRLETHFFKFHLVEEAQHGDWLATAVEGFVKTAEDERLIRKGALNAAAWWGEFWEGMYNYVFKEAGDAISQ